jgi:hypothetical protein
MTRVRGFWRRLFQSGFFAAALVLLSLAFFIERGPYRALRDSRSGDFTTVYAASRCWLKHENPYAREDLTLELTRAGAPASLIREQDQHLSLYPISVMPLAAVFAWLPWRAANGAWCLFSLVCFAASIAVLLRELPALLSNTRKTGGVKRPPESRGVFSSLMVARIRSLLRFKRSYWRLVAACSSALRTLVF